MKRSLYLLFILVAGAVGAVLRGISITQGLEWNTGLPIPGTMCSMLLKVLCVVVLVLSVVLSKLCFPTQQRQQYEGILGKLGAPARLVCILCGIGMVGTGIGALFSVNAMVLEQTSEYHPFGMAALGALLAQWVLCIVSGVLLVGFAVHQDGREATKGQGLRAAVPMLWACLMLIMAYHENSSNPVMMDYAYELLLAIAVLASFYAISGLFFAVPSARRVAVCAGMAGFLMVMVVGGLVLTAGLDAMMLTLTLTAPTADLFRMAAYLFAGIYLLAQLVSVSSQVSRG